MPRHPDFIQRYRIVKPLGRGGMGVVYLAHDPALDRRVAIKLLRDFDSDDLRERFSREARAVARLTHINIVTLFDVGEYEGQPFIAMEFTEGETLGGLIERRPPLSLVRRLELMFELCAGLGYAHRAGIIHRDIKPANLIITAEGVLKILDFGLARVMSDASMNGLTLSGALMGTPHYMSPEQIEGQPVDHRSDIFAAGLVLYEVLASRKAYIGDTPHSVFRRILEGPPPPLEHFGLGLAPDLIAIVNKALEREPPNRYQDLEAMGRDLIKVRLRLQSAGSREDSPLVLAPGPDDTIPNVARPPRTPRRGTDRELIAGRRAAEINAQLADAVHAFHAEDFERVVAASERVLHLDPENARALELSDDARIGMDERRARAWIAEARTQLREGAFAEASGLLNRAVSLNIMDHRPEIGRVMEALRHEIDEARERARAITEAVNAAERGLIEGAPDAALRAADTALALDFDHARARQLKAQALQALETRRVEAVGRARDLTEAARARFAGGDVDGALAMLVEVSSPHDLVSQCLADLRRELAAREQRRAEQQRHASEAAAQLTSEQLAAGLEALSAGDFEGAVSACERVLELTPDNARALGLIDEARMAIDERQGRAWLAEAREQLEHGAFTTASDLLDRAVSLTFTARHPELAQQAKALRREVDGARERVRAIDEAMSRAQRAFNEGALNSALRGVDAALRLDPDCAEARRLKIQTLEAFESRRIAETRDAQALAEAARERFAAGDVDGALAMLLNVSSPHELISGCLADLRKDAIREKERAEHERRTQEARSRLIKEHLGAARVAFDASDFERAIGACEQVLALDPDNAPALELREEARALSGLKRGRDWILEARTQLAHGALSAASDLLGQAVALNVTAPHPELGQQIQVLRREIDEATERARAFSESMDDVQRNLKEGALDRALRAVEAALRLAPANDQARQLKDRVLQALESRREAKLARAGELSRAARSRFAAGDVDGAIAMLDVSEPHELISRCLADLRREAAEREQQRVEREPGASEATAQLTTDSPETIAESSKPLRPQVLSETRSATGDARRLGVWAASLIVAGLLLFAGVRSVLKYRAGPPPAAQLQIDTLASAPAPQANVTTPSLEQPPPTANNERETGSPGGNAEAAGASVAQPLPVTPRPPPEPTPTAFPAPTVVALQPPATPSAVPPEAPPTTPPPVPPPASPTATLLEPLPVAPSPAPPATPEARPTEANASLGSRAAGGEAELAMAMDRTAVEAVVERYRQAYNRKDMNSIRQLYPDATNELTFGAAMKQCSAVDLNFPAPPKIDVLQGGRAVVETTSVYSCTPSTRQRKMTSPAQKDTFWLKKDGSAWIIVELLVPRGK